jgi:hypothetical protein
MNSPFALRPIPEYRCHPHLLTRRRQAFGQTQEISHGQEFKVHRLSPSYAADTSRGLTVIGLTLPLATANAGSARAPASEPRVIAQHRLPTGTHGYHRRSGHAFNQGIRTSPAKDPFVALPTTNTPDPQCDFSKYQERWDPVKC